MAPELVPPLLLPPVLLPEPLLELPVLLLPPPLVELDPVPLPPVLPPPPPQAARSANVTKSTLKIVRRRMNIRSDMTAGVARDDEREGKPFADCGRAVGLACPSWPNDRKSAVVIRLPLGMSKVMGFGDTSAPGFRVARSIPEAVK